MESGLDAPPDWRRTAFWRKSSFMQAWERAQRLPLSGVDDRQSLAQPTLVRLAPSLIMLHLHCLCMRMCTCTMPCRRNQMAMAIPCWIQTSNLRAA